MMLSPHRKLLVFLLLILCSPLYVLLRFFYGTAFSRMVVLALLLHILALPILFPMLMGQPSLAPYLRHYSEEYTVALLILAVFAAPVHIAWMLFMWFAGDGRYDPDEPGKPLLPFLHPWLVDFPAAIGLPFAVASLGAARTVIPVRVPQTFGFELPDIPVSSGWWFASVAVSVAYLAVAVMTVEPPRLRLRRWWIMRQRPRTLRFDAARLAIRRFAREGRKEDIIER